MSMDDHIPAADFHIQASPQASALPKLVLKHGEAFLVADRRGDFPAHFEGELGFYRAGTRHLRWLEVRLHGESPLLLGADTAPDNDQILVTLTNADVHAPAASGGGVMVPRNTIYLDRRLTLYDPHLLESVTVTNFHVAPCEVLVEVIFTADFRDVFEVRGTQRAERGQLLPEEREGGRIRLRYLGRDGVERATIVTFDPPPALIAQSRAVYRLALGPSEGFRFDITATAESADAGAPAPVPRLGEAVTRLRASSARLVTRAARVVTDHESFNALIARSLVDLNMLITETDAGRVPYAGVPWYVTPFGRDSLITAYQLLPYDAEVAAGTLRFLARWQSHTDDAFLDAEPGKILHEYRLGEMANCREIPFVPYYGTVDATPLFVTLLGDYVRWTGDVALARELWPAAQAALAWMSAAGRPHRYLTYTRRSRLGLGNQGWKDSEDAVMHADGTLARAPIALCEAQGYAYAAYGDAAELATLLGDTTTAARATAEAEALRRDFERDFWLEDDQCYALAIDGEGRPCEVIASNAGHCLWSGLVDERRAALVAKRLLADDMFSGWGIRTLSARERRYNPMSYHNGSVWPHDNALAAAGFRRYRLLEHVITVTSALFDASHWFEHARVPELFCGFARHPDHGPVAYPVACAPQAWAAGSTLQLLTALIGVDADAVHGRVTFHNPVLPPWLRFVEIHDLRVGRSALDVAISRGRDGASVELISRRGDVELIVRR